MPTLHHDQAEWVALPPVQVCFVPSRGISINPLSLVTDFRRHNLPFIDVRFV